ITVLDSSNANHRIRLLGIDTPEKGQAFGTQSKQNLSEAVFDKVVTIEWSKHDRYGRIVGKVLLTGRDVCLDQGLVGGLSAKSLLIIESTIASGVGTKPRMFAAN